MTSGIVAILQQACAALGRVLFGTGSGAALADDAGMVSQGRL